jgi:hypothetical protein
MIRFNGESYSYFDTFVGRKRADFTAKVLKERGYKSIINKMQGEENVFVMYVNPAIQIQEGKTVSPSSLILTRKYLESEKLNS